MYAIYCMPDHAHILVSYSPSQNITDLVRDIKSRSTVWINKERLIDNFHWQSGYEAFTIAERHSKSVLQYILNQEEHHKNKSYEKEYLRILNENAIDYDQDYVFND